jgi:hypothetical protein
LNAILLAITWEKGIVTKLLTPEDRLIRGLVSDLMDSLLNDYFFENLRAKIPPADTSPEQQRLMDQILKELEDGNVADGKE